MNKNESPTCPRCGARMYGSVLYGCNERAPCLLCPICGECLDPVIMVNRMATMDRIRLSRKHGARISIPDQGAIESDFDDHPDEEGA